MSRSAVRRLLCGVLAAAMIAATVVVTRVVAPSSAPPSKAHLADKATTTWPQVDSEGVPGLSAALATAPQVITLHAATSAPAPTPPAVSNSSLIRPHEVFAFAPYWTLSSLSSLDVKDASTIAYFGLDVSGNGTISRSGPGWEGYQSAELVNLVNEAHAAGDRVVLTVECFDQGDLDQLVTDPTAAATLASQVAQLVAAEQMDGVNFDFEGTGSADREALVKLIGTVSFLLKATDPNWQLTEDIYASSLDGAGFFDASALASELDAVFVMAYDMGGRDTPSPTAPLIGSGYTDASVVSTFAGQVPASKVILGIPFYGYAWPTAGDWLGAPATGAAFPLSYSQIVAAGRPTYWDPTTDTPWTAWKADGQWYEAFFDDPQSIALKVAAATKAGLGGVGVWALGMDGTDGTMLGAITGQAPPDKSYSPAPEPAPTVLASPPVTAPPAGSPEVRLTQPATAPAGPSPLAGKKPAASLCALLAYQPSVMGTVQTAAQQQAGMNLPAQLPASMTALAGTAGCNGSTPEAIRARGPDPTVCPLLSGLAQEAAVVQGAAGSLPTSLSAVVAKLAASVGCSGISASAPPISDNCAGMTSMLDAVADESAPLQRYVETGLGRSLGVDLASAVEGLSTDCTDSGSPVPSPQISTVCTLLADVSAEAGAIQSITEAQLGRPLGVDLENVVGSLGTPFSCPSAGSTGSA